MKRYTSLTDTTFSVSTFQVSHLAYLGLKCVNIACPPILVIGDTLGELAAFLDAQQAATINTDVALTVLTDLISGISLIRNGMARLIAGCGCCSS